MKKVKPTQAREQSRKKYFSFSPPRGLTKCWMSKIMKHPENETQNLFFYVGFWKMEEVRQ